MTGVVFVALVAALVLWQFARVRSRTSIFRQAPPTLADYRTALGAQSSPPSPVQWTDCPVCGCPTIAPGARGCPVCDWEPGPEVSAEARVNFAAYGSVRASQRDVVPDTAVLAAKRAAVDLCQRAREGMIEPEMALRELADLETFIAVANARRADELRG